MGVEHSSFGNRAHKEWDWTNSRLENMRRIAVLHGNGQFMQNWSETLRRRSEIGRRSDFFSPWMHYVLPAYFREPEPRKETQYAKVFPLEGWVTVSSAPPSDLNAQKDAVSMTFVARPRGGYGHSFASDNAFDIYAYGETVAVGGGTTDNELNFPRHSMSHNTILVDGNSQLISDTGDYSRDTSRGHALDRAVPIRARIITYQEGKNAQGTPYVYWAGDATNAYGPDSGLKRFIRHVLFVDNRYFVVYDDLRMSEDHPGAKFQWLYHIVPATGVLVNFDPNTFSFRYSVGQADMVVRHLANTADLTFLDLLRQQGQVNVAKCGVNPVSCPEDFRNESTPRVPPEEAIVDAHHIWIMSQTPKKEAHFVAAIVPFKQGQEAPTITASRETDKRMEVTLASKTTSVSFDRAVSADIVVDTEAIGNAQLAPSMLYFAQFGNGQGLASDVVLTNSSTTATAKGTIRLLDDRGLTLPIDLLSPSSPSADFKPLPSGLAEFSIPSLGTLTLKTSGKGALTVGTVTVSSDIGLAGVIRFQITGIGIAGVGSSQPLDALVTPVRRTSGGINTGVALFNITDEAVMITLTLRDQNGATLAPSASPLELPAKGHLARFITELFPDIVPEGFEGTLVVQVSGGQVAATALELGPKPGEFTTLPVTNLQ